MPVTSPISSGKSHSLTMNQNGQGLLNFIAKLLTPLEIPYNPSSSLKRVSLFLYYSNVFNLTALMSHNFVIIADPQSGYKTYYDIQSGY